VTLPVDPAPYGTRAPAPLLRGILAFTRSLPANWLGLRASTPFRRVAIDWLGERPVDTELWGSRVRLYPDRNSCEKNALFTPQTYDVLERDVLAAAIGEKPDGPFTFVDIGANVGLYSLFMAGRGARVLAIEPQPGIVERLSFNVGLNPQLDITVVPLALSDRDGEVELVICDRDRSGTYVHGVAGRNDGTEMVRVPCRPLLTIVRQAGIVAIDALKIDIEGAEDLALAPFLGDAEGALLPRLILIEDRPDWRIDLYALLRRRGYAESARSRHNLIFRLA
jgi:FkbM family methyltransferase